MRLEERQEASDEAVDIDRLVSAAAELGARSPSIDNAPSSDAAFRDFVQTLRDWIAEHYDLPGSQAEQIEKTHLLLHVMMGASTLGDAVGLLQRFRPLVWGDRGIRASTGGAVTVISFQQSFRQGPRGLLSDLWSLSFLLTELEFLVGGPLEGVAGRVRQPACLPPSTARLLFRRSITYEANELALVLPNRHFRRPVVAQPSQISDFAGRLVPCTVGAEKTSHAFTELIAGMIQAEARQFAGAPAKLEDVAARLGLSIATLRRRLASDGATFRDIRERVVDELAKDFLRAGLSVEATAGRLGYSDAFAFRRAFHRRQNCSPSAFRSKFGREHRSGLPEAGLARPQ